MKPQLLSTQSSVKPPIHNDSLKSHEATAASLKTQSSEEELTKKRKEIGFETESVLDNEWRDLRVDFKKLGFNYLKLSKQNLTGISVILFL